MKRTTMEYALSVRDGLRLAISSTPAILTTHEDVLRHQKLRAQLNEVESIITDLRQFHVEPASN